MKAFRLVSIIIIGISILIGIMAYRFYFIPWDDSDVVKKVDCERAIIETEFDKEVLTNVENYIQLNNYILINFDSIIGARKKIRVSWSDKKNGIIKLDDKFSHLYDKLLNNKISTITLNRDQTIE